MFIEQSDLFIEPTNQKEQIENEGIILQIKKWKNCPQDCNAYLECVDDCYSIDIIVDGLTFEVRLVTVSNTPQFVIIINEIKD